MLKSQNKFKLESSIAPTLSEIEFIIELNITEKEAKECFHKIEHIFNKLQKTTQESSIAKVAMIVCDPSEKSQQFKKFEVSSELGLKTKMRVSLDICIFVRFENIMNFWEKGLLITSVIDVLEGFCENIRKDKNIFIELKQAKFSQDEVIEDSSLVEDKTLTQ